MKTNSFIYSIFLFLICFILAVPAKGQETDKLTPEPAKEQLSLEIKKASLSKNWIEQDRIENYLWQDNDPFLLQMRFNSFAGQRFFNYDKALSSNLFITTYHGTEIYRALGGITPVSATLSWQANKHISISGGVYVAKMYYHPSQLSPLTDGGFNLSFAYMINERFGLHAFGSYSVTDRMMQNRPFFFPQNSVGGGARFMFNDNFGMEGGVIFQQHNGHTRPGIYAAPVFKAGNVKIKIIPSVSTGR